jgi:hypothetical protein
MARCLGVLGRPLGGEMAEECPCEGKWGPAWHSKYKIPLCAHAAEIRKAQRADKQGMRWVPGTSISVPEQEEL